MVYPIDLHTHSTASDGQLTPGGLIEKAAALGLDTLALTDHDTVAGIEEAWSVARQRGVTFIPGVELSADFPEGECHVLGYFLDCQSPALQKDLSLFRDSRLRRGERMVELLRDLGMPLSWERVQELAHGGTVTRSHVAEALLEAGHVSSRGEAFERYIGHAGPAYVQRYKLTPEGAVRSIRQAHGVPVLAHPTFVEPGRDWMADLGRLTPWPFLERLVDAGLLGLEAYYGEYPAELAAGLAQVAAHYGLVATGGSDFHGHAEGTALGCASVPPEAVSELFRLAQLCGSPWVSESAVVAPS